MGMDVSGKKPANETGDYFGVNVWTWRVIHHLCDEAIKQEGLSFLTDDWALNDGMGLAAQEHCDLLADALSKYVAQNTPANGVFEIDLGVYVKKGSGQFLDGPGPDAESAYRAHISYVEAFITFLRNCGGFEIH